MDFSTRATIVFADRYDFESNGQSMKGGKVLALNEPDKKNPDSFGWRPLKMTCEFDIIEELNKLDQTQMTHTMEVKGVLRSTKNRKGEDVVTPHITTLVLPKSATSTTTDKKPASAKP